MNNDVTITPIGVVFAIIAFSPYLYMKFGSAFGDLFIFLLPLFFIIIILSLYFHYRQRSIEHSSSFFIEVEKDLPDMSPVHTLLFFLISAPLWLFIIGGRLNLLWGIGGIYILYTIYYYGFKKR